jgi:hypothetical protein
MCFSTRSMAWSGRVPRVWLGVAVLLLSPLLHAEEAVVCHYTYGGETKQLVAPPVSSPYGVKGIPVGSFFRFRVVFQKTPADLASIKVYTYAERAEGALLIHQATYPYPPAGRGAAPYGFSGQHAVYEPMRDGELQYWCELQALAESGEVKR